MKKIVLVIIVTFGVFAQSGLNLAFGVNKSIATIKNTPTGIPDPEGATGIVAGISYDMDLFLMFTLNTGFQYSKSKFNVLGTDVENTEYQIPVLLKAYIFPWVVKPYLQGGITYVIADKATIKGQNDEEVNSGAFITLGGGVDIDLTAIPLIPLMFVDARVVLGKKDEYFKNTQIPLTVNQAQVTVGVRF